MYGTSMNSGNLGKAISTAGVMIMIFLAGCSASTDSANDSSQPAPSVTASSTTTGVAPESTWEEVCKAAYAAGLGNAGISEETSWVKDCSEECALPESVGQCEDMAKDLGVDAP